jgi:uncharacterized protein (DUF58 family)
MNDRIRQYLSEGERTGMRYALGLPRLAPVGVVGGALGQRTGSSLEFKDYREYQVGDDLRHIDWNAYARSDQLSVKLYREEIVPHADIVVDGSRSMALEDSAKEQAALALAAFFAAAAANAGFSHCAWLMGERVRPVTNGTGRPATWDGIEFVHRGSPAESLDRDPPAWRPRGVRILLSDLLWVGDPLQTVRHFAERAAAAVVVQVLAEADVNPPTEGNLRLTDSETEMEREVTVDGVAPQRYRAALARHQQNWHQACRQAGAVFTTVVGERWLRDERLDELVASEVLQVI